MKTRLVLPALLLSACAALPGPARPGFPHPEELRWIRIEVERAIRKGACPGAVVFAGIGDRILYRQAFGRRAVAPKPEAMTEDTIFDLASVTKPVATATSVMLLAERGRIDLDAPVSRYLPEFRGNGKEKITVRQLLLHQGGLTPDNSLRDYRDGPEKAWKRICALPLLYPPGTKFKYSDVGFLVLGKLVERVSGKRLDRFAQENIFRPLGMGHTRFLPPPAWRPKIAPTQRVEGKILRGVVHDPRARLLGGVAGHAGLFSTAADLARFSSMMLGGGSLKGVRILKKETVRLMTRLTPDSRGRGLGWDLTSAYSSPRGHWLTKGVSFGHSGFTGTSLWMDPATGAWVVFLSNRVHPDGKGNVIALRRKVGDAVGRAMGLDRRGTIPGIEVLAQEGFAPLRGLRVGLITNHTGRTRDGRSDIDLLFHAPGVTLLRLFSPEHGIRGVKDQPLVPDSKDPETGLPIKSLYGKTRRPTKEMLQGLDALVFDIQDIGTRFYTYISTMLYAMEEASKSEIRFFVLDRPDPIGGHRVFGPLPDRDKLSFTACAGIPLVHGMTTGELARLFRAEKRLPLRLTVIPVKGWKRNQWFDETDLPWVNPSPNMRSLRAAALYPGVGLLEATNLSVGRGTPTPFEILGAPWIDGKKLAAALEAARLEGLVFTPCRFTPKASKFRGKPCGGIRIGITDREALRPVKLGIVLAETLKRLFGKAFQVEKVNRLLKNDRVQAMIEAGLPFPRIRASWRKDLEAFLVRRKKALLYP